MTSTHTSMVRGCMAAALVLVICADARAQAAADDGFNVSPFVGIVFGGNLENAPATVGVALGYGGQGLGVEGELAYFKAEQGVLTQFDTSVWLNAINVLWEFAPRGNAIPYALGGIAWQHTDTDLEGIPGFETVEDDTSASFAFGAGLKAMLTERAGIRLDLRYVNGRDLAPDFWHLYSGVTWRFGVR